MLTSKATPIKVFLVDDHKTVLWGLEQLINSAAPHMVVAGSATTCAGMFADIATDMPDVILLDLDMGGESGLDCLEKLGQQSTARVLVLTGSGDLKAHQRAVVCGARGVVHKQEPAEVILRAIEKVNDGEIWLDRTNLGEVMLSLVNGHATDPQAAKIAKLTPKERQIVNSIAELKSAPNKVIAGNLHMSEHTLRNHLTTIYDKLETRGRMELYLYATNHRQSLAPH